MTESMQKEGKEGKFRIAENIGEKKIASRLNSKVFNTLCLSGQGIREYPIFVCIWNIRIRFSTNMWPLWVDALNWLSALEKNKQKNVLATCCFKQKKLPSTSTFKEKILPLTCSYKQQFAVD